MLVYSESGHYHDKLVHLFLSLVYILLLFLCVYIDCAIHVTCLLWEQITTNLLDLFVFLDIVTFTCLLLTIYYLLFVLNSLGCTTFAVDTNSVHYTFVDLYTMQFQMPERILTAGEYILVFVDYLACHNPPYTNLVFTMCKFFIYWLSIIHFIVTLIALFLIHSQPQTNIGCCIVHLPMHALIFNISNPLLMVSLYLLIESYDDTNIVQFLALPAHLTDVYIYEIILSILSFLNNFYSLVRIMIILLSGDVHTNPGPYSETGYHDIRLCLTNIRGLRSNFSHLNTTLKDNYDIICINETFLDPSCPNSKLSVPGFQEIIRNDRQGFGGGVGVYVRNCIACKRRVDLETNALEIIALEVRSHNNKFILINVYNPNNRTLDFYNEMQSCIDQVRTCGISKFIIVGDLNSDLRTPSGGELLHFSDRNLLRLHVTEPTRFTGNSSTCLDQVLSNCPESVTSCTVLAPVGSSDHCTVSATLLFRFKSPQAYKRHVWLYKRADFDGLREKLSDVAWSQELESNNVNDTTNIFTSILLNYARQYIPNRVITVRPGDTPWYNTQLRALCRKKDRIHYKAKTKDTPELWAKFRSIRNEYISACRVAESDYEISLEHSLDAGPTIDPRRWYQISKSLLGRNTSLTYPPIHVSGDIVVDPQAKALLYNDFFLSICTLDESMASLPQVNESQIPTIDSISVAENEVLDLLKCIDTSKATGPDGISPLLLKELATVIYKPLTVIFNQSLQNKEFPSLWKQANVIPIHKKGNVHLCTNYRPVSLLSCVSKIFERIIFKHMYNFILDNQLITKSQSGFTPGDGTTYQLIYLYHNFCEAIDQGKEVRVVFCDISKAFDKVWHSGLLFKLHKNGIRGDLLEFLGNYLNDRKQRVTIEGHSSPWGIIRAGVPQGSVLGPLLFLIYINDIVDIINNKISLFADDTSLSVIVETPLIAANLLNDDLMNISNWANQWLVSFNSQKTDDMVISRKIDKPQHPGLLFNNAEIARVDTHKHLGLVLSSSLSWSAHIQEISTKACKTLNVMHALKYKLSRKALENIYITFVRPTLEYCDVIWDGCLQKDKDLLENIQLAAARVVTGARRGTSHSALLKETGWQTLQQRRDTHKLIMLYKILNNLTPEYLKELIPPLASQRSDRTLRNSSNIQQIKSKNNYFRDSFLPSTISKWNSIPITVRNSPSLAIFRSELNKTMGPCKPPNHYYYGERKAGIILACMRMGCSNLNADLAKIQVIPSAQCACGDGVEDALHYFFVCTKYTAVRNALQTDILTVAPFTLNTLLYGIKGSYVTENTFISQAVHRYINGTGRFS